MPDQGPYTYTPSQASQFERLGHPGKYVTVQSFTGGQTFYTGSNYGYGAILVVTGTGLTASLSNGGSIGLADLNAKTMYDLSISSISGSANSGLVYLFKRQGVA